MWYIKNALMTIGFIGFVGGVAYLRYRWGKLDNLSRFDRQSHPTVKTKS